MRVLYRIVQAIDEQYIVVNCKIVAMTFLGLMGGVLKSVVKVQATVIIFSHWH